MIRRERILDVEGPFVKGLSRDNFTIFRINQFTNLPFYMTRTNEPVMVFQNCLIYVILIRELSVTNLYSQLSPIRLGASVIFHKED